MNSQQLKEILRAFLRELPSKKLFAAIIFSLVTLTVAAAAVVWPVKYQTSAILYVDRKNVIEPLLGEQAAVQEVDPVQEAKERIYSRRILESVALQAGLIDKDSTAKSIAQVINMLNGGALGHKYGIQIYNRGANYISLNYTDVNPETSFNVISALINAFILEISKNKRQSSHSAFTFIDAQAAIYKEQLQDAEDKLKTFNALNRDGSLSGVGQKINTLRSEIEGLSLQIGDLRARRSTVRKQLQKERQFISSRSREDVYRESIREYQSQLDTLLLSVTETHPDVVSLTFQIEDLKSAIEVANNTVTNNSSEAAASLNPLYERLRRSLTEIELEFNSSVSRKRSMGKILEQEYERSERLAGRQAKLTELTRDYDVTRELYEDMLNRKEKARLTMTLDIEGQGTSYKIHEPPTFPLTSTGLKRKHLIMSAPILGLFAPLGIILGFILFDPRVRLPYKLDALESAQTLMVIQPLKDRSNRTYSQYNKRIIAILVFTFVIYIGICTSMFYGVV